MSGCVKTEKYRYIFQHVMLIKAVTVFFNKKPKEKLFNIKNCKI